MTKAAAKAAEPKTTHLEEAQAEDNLDFWEQWGELGPGRQVEVSREPGRVYLAIVPLDEDFGPALIQEKWGGGKFSFRARENGRFIKGFPPRHILIEGPPKVQTAPAAEESAEVVALRTKLAELTEGEPPAKGDNSNIILAVVGMMAPVLTAIVTAAMDRPQQTSAIEILEFSRKLSKDARKDGGSDPMDPIKDFGLPLLKEVAAMNRLEGAKANGTNRIAATPEAKGPEPPSTFRVPTTTQELAEFIAGYCAPHAKRGASPSLRAEVFLEDLGIQNPPLMAQAVSLARLDNVLDRWAEMVPSVAEEREWHGEFISEVRRFADEADADPGADDSEHTEGRSGDASDGERDGATSEAGGEG